MGTFDYKPKLFEAMGKAPESAVVFPSTACVLLKPLWQFRPGGQCGALVSDLFPHLREQMDDICLIRSMNSNDNEHYTRRWAFTPGSFFFSRPGIGAWVSYGLGRSIRTCLRSSCLLRKCLMPVRKSLQRFSSGLSSRRASDPRQGTNR